MHTMAARWRLPTLMILLMLALSACGGSEGVDEAPSGEPTQTRPPVSPDPVPPGGASASPDPGDGEQPIESVDVGDFEDSQIDPHPARDCDPDDPARAEVGTVEEIGDGRDDDDLGAAAQGTYTNQRGQQFVITAIAADMDLAEGSLGELGLCLEAFPIDELPPSQDEVEYELEEALVEETVAVLNEMDGPGGPTAAELAQERDEVGEGEERVVTLASLVEAAGSDADAVLGEVLGRIERRFGGDVEPTVTALWSQVDAPFLEALEPDDNDEALREEIADEGAIVYQFELDEETRREVAETPVALVAYIDPPINRYSSRPWKRVYRAKCRRSAWARIKATSGRMTLFMWRAAPHHRNLGSRYANAGSVDRRFPKGISGSSSSRRQYDIRVEGRRDDSSYNLRGSWTLGRGGGC